MTKYKRYISVSGKKPILVVVENGNIIDRNPTKEELKGLKDEPSNMYSDKEYLKECLRRFYKKYGRVPTAADLSHNCEYPGRGTYFKYFGGLDNALREAGLWEKRYNSTNTCHRCIEEDKNIDDSQLPDKAYKEKDKDGKNTGEWICRKHWRKDYEKNDPNSYSNIIKSMSDSRTDNLDPNSPKGKADKSQELACELYGYIDLNKRYDNYATRIDCIDEKTGLLYQIRGRRYNPEYRQWYFGHFEGELHKDYKDMILFCFNKDRKIVERIYRIPFEKEIKKKRKGIAIYKNFSKGGWYEQYRVKDEEEIKRANDIWQKILEKDNNKK